jgi:proline dehydrogenase
MKIRRKKEVNCRRARRVGVVARFDLVCSEAHKNNVSLLIDGEESWMQDAADELVTDMMRSIIKEKPIVFNTLQLYRWDRLDYLKSCMKWQRGKGLLLNEVSSWRLHGKEHARAKKKGIQHHLCIQRGYRC